MSEARVEHAEDLQLVTELIELKEQGADAPMVFSLFGPPTPAEERRLRHNSILEKLEDQIRAKLVSGELRAFGRDNRLPINTLPVRIPADVWLEAEIDFEASTIRHGGALVSDIRVRAPRAAMRIAAETRCRKWLSQKIASGITPASRSAVLQEAFALIPELSESAFNRAWRDLAPLEWKQPGRKSRRR